MTGKELLDRLLSICDFLQKKHITYMLTGGIAVSLWTKPRATANIDIAVLLEEKDLPQFIKLVKEEGFIILEEKPMKFKRATLFRMLIKTEDGTFIPVNLVLSDTDYRRKAIQRKRKIEVRGKGIWIISPEDLILAKLLSGREQDILDAKLIVKMQKKSLDISYLRDYAKRLNLTKSIEKLGL